MRSKKGIKKDTRFLEKMIWKSIKIFEIRFSISPAADNALKSTKRTKKQILSKFYDNALKKTKKGQKGQK